MDDIRYACVDSPASGVGNLCISPPESVIAEASTQARVNSGGCWIAGVANPVLKVVVLIGAGLQYGRWGLSGFTKNLRTVNVLTFEQVVSLMKADIVSKRSLKPEDVDAFLRHPLMSAQMKMLMGLPGFVVMALDSAAAVVRLAQNRGGS